MHKWEFIRQQYCTNHLWQREVWTYHRLRDIKIYKIPSRNPKSWTVLSSLRWWRYGYFRRNPWTGWLRCSLSLQYALSLNYNLSLMRSLTNAETLPSLHVEMLYAIQRRFRAFLRSKYRIPGWFFFVWMSIRYQKDADLEWIDPWTRNNFGRISGWCSVRCFLECQIYEKSKR